MVEKFEFNIKEVNLSVFLMDIYLLMCLNVKDKGLSFNVVLKIKILEFIYIDFICLCQVLLNFILNVVKFIDKGSIMFIIFFDELFENNLS